MSFFGWLVKMETAKIRAGLKSAGIALWNLTLISVGSVLCAAAINGILIPKHFVSGGLTGLAIVIHYLAPALQVGWIYFLLNIPLYALGWIYVGRRFFYYSIAGLFIFSGAVSVIHFPIAVQDKILSALLAGIISGAGSGIILRSFGSAGGTDILSIILYKKFSIRPGNTVLMFSTTVLFSAAVLFSIDSALYTLVFLYVNAAVLNIIVSGLSQRKAVFIISSAWQDLSHGILKEINRGVTVLQGEGGYSGKEEKVLYTVVTFRELPRLKQMIRAMDPSAFVVVNDTLEVMGQRIGNQPHW
jgi:uncharacterized membrane-anchored protein YitT (DUF2179 family)